MEEFTNIFEELDSLYEENNNFRSDKAKNMLVDKYFKDYDIENKPEFKKAFKNRCLLHHINGDHNNDNELENDVLIVAEDAEDAKLAHKLLHILSYCFIKDELLNKLRTLDVEFYYHPNTSGEPQEISLETLANGLVQHDKSLRDIALIDQDESDLDALGKNNFRIDSQD